MKKILKLLISALAVCLIGAAVFGLVVFASTDDGKNGTFNGSPAHIDKKGNLYIDEINFPDEVFRGKILNMFNIYDIDSDGMLSESEADEITSLDVEYIDYLYYSDEEPIFSLSGVEFFTELEYLNCAKNSLKELDVSKLVKLKSLNFYYNHNNKDYGWRINNIDLSHNTELVELNCGSNRLTELDLSNNTKLTTLNCSLNFDMKNLDLSKNTALTTLKCSNNALTELDLSCNHHRRANLPFRRHRRFHRIVLRLRPASDRRSCWPRNKWRGSVLCPLFSYTRY